MYEGVIAPLVTPLDDRGAVCERSVFRLVESMAAKVSALMPTLSSGEGWKLDHERWRSMVTYTKRAASGLPVLAGVQLPDTAQVIARGRLALELGVDAIVVTTPFVAGLSQAAIQAHYRAIREEVPLPLFLYNEQSLSGNALEVETIRDVGALGNVVGIKESSGSPDFTNRLVAARVGMPVFQGWENLLLATCGVDGCVAPLANIEPDLLVGMLKDPSSEGQREIDAACDKYGVLRDDWYAALKNELTRRGTIATARVV